MDAARKSGKPIFSDGGCWPQSPAPKTVGAGSLRPAAASGILYFRRDGDFLEIFEISSDYIELNKLLKATGLCESGGVAKTVITGGQVKVDDIVEYRVRCKIRKGQTVWFNGRTVIVG